MHHKILLVDDDKDVREALGCILELKGYSVDTAENGADALQKLRCSGPPCVVVLDLMMPVMDGWEFRNELLKHDDLESVPVVVISGVAEYPAARSVDAVAHLRKPVDLASLYRLLQEHC